jgi:hypothetical protein
MKGVLKGIVIRATDGRICMLLCKITARLFDTVEVSVMVNDLVGGDGPMFPNTSIESRIRCGLCETCAHGGVGQNLKEAEVVRLRDDKRSFSIKKNVSKVAVACVRCWPSYQMSVKHVDTYEIG